MKVFTINFRIRLAIILLLSLQLFSSSLLFAQSDDPCAAPTLNSSTVCSNTAGSIVAGHTNTAGFTVSCGTANRKDVWYRFTARTATPTISVTNISFTAGRVELYSGACGSLTGWSGGPGAACVSALGTPGSGTLNPTGLTPGTTYYIRIYSNSNNTGTFNICITDPFNDNCSAAILAPINADNSCTNTISGTLNNATTNVATPNGGCATNTNLYDVWYYFDATSTSHSIETWGYWSNYTNRQIMIYTGTCAGLSFLACTPVDYNVDGWRSISINDFQPGTRYFIRVIHSTNGSGITTNGNFTVCIKTPTSAAPPVNTGKSYVNVTRPNGGTVQNGDVLEFRSSIGVGFWGQAGSTFNTIYLDTIPTGLSFVSNSIKFRTNEGLAMESGFTGSTTLTDNSGDDEAVYDAATRVLRVNVASLRRIGNAGYHGRQLTYLNSVAVTPITNSTTGGGKINCYGRPNQFSGFVILQVAYRVTVTAASNTNFNTSNGSFKYKPGTPTAADVTVNFPRYTIRVSDGSLLCPNSVGINTYTGGDFGSGTTKHDSTQLTVAPGYTWTPFQHYNPGDGLFSVVNNSSSGDFTNKYSPLPSVAPDTSRVFDVWDVIGDHTGASNPDSGNLATPRGTLGGYMAIVNAAYGINTAVQKTVTGLCPDTYYEFSAWFKNICSRCSSDSAGRTPPETNFKSYIASKVLNDSSGVSPDLTYTIDGIDYYTTGNIIYDKRWIKKGFLFRTGPSQTSATLTIRNNAPGGGGNDWAIDDINLATCFPNMSYSPTYNPTVCANNQITIRDTVRSYYDNYTRYKWQRRPFGSSTWSDISGATGTATPVLVGGFWQYVVSYTIPLANTTAANNGDQYRLVVASTSSNLGSSTCSYTDPTNIVLNVLTDCGDPLAVKLLSVNGRLNNNKGVINWVTSREDEPVYYIIEKSIDGSSFTTIATVNGYNNASAETNNYSFNDPSVITDKVFYRVVMVTNQIQRKYSTIISLQTGSASFGFAYVVNPFSDELQYSINSPATGMIRAELLDINGKTVRTVNQQVYAGSNALSIYDTKNLSSGMYLLKVSLNDKLLISKVVKK
jgi:trimeric autotransporter adhesin